MKILLVTEYFPTRTYVITGGVERRVLRLAQLFSKEHTVTVLAAHTSSAGEREIEGVRVIRCGPKRRYTSSGSLLQRVRMLYAMVKIGRTLSCEVVEASNATVYLAGFLIGTFTKAKRVAWVPDIFGTSLVVSLGAVSGIAAFVTERLGIILPWDHWIALSYHTQAKLQRIGIPERKISVVYGGVDLTPQKLPTTSDSMILTIARLVHYKRVEDIVHALAFVRRSVPGARLCIVGEGPRKARLVALAERTEVSGWVQFTGNIPDEQLREIISRAMVYCSASVVEGFGLAVVEAMAQGVPCVISDIATHREVTGGKGGLFFRPMDKEDLAYKLTLLLNDSVLRKEKAQQALEVAKQYAWPRIADETLGVYNEVLNRRI